MLTRPKPSRDPKKPPPNVPAVQDRSSCHPFPFFNRFKNNDFKSPQAACKKHPWCKISAGRAFTDLDNSLTIPYQCNLRDPADLQTYAE